MPSMNTELFASWTHAQNAVTEDEVMTRARERGSELGAHTIDPAGASILQLLSNLYSPRNAVQIGAGVGVASLSILRGMGTNGTLTVIESDLENVGALREALREDRVLGARARIITERAATVLGRLTDRAYDMVLIDAEHENLLDYVAEAKRLIGKRGVIIICNAFDEHRLAKPAVRKASTVSMRDAMRMLREDPNLLCHLLPTEQGLFIAAAKH